MLESSTRGKGPVALVCSRPTHRSDVSSRHSLSLGRLLFSFVRCTGRVRVHAAGDFLADEILSINRTELLARTPD